MLAGDIARPAEAVAWASRLGKPVLYVPGNHEFYGGSLDGSAAQLKRCATGTAIRVLDDEVELIGNVRFLGSTLWTDFMLFGDGRGARGRDGRGGALHARLQPHPPATRPADAVHAAGLGAALFQRHAAWLAAELAKPHDGPTVVITHHAPSPASIHPRFAGSLLNACFVSDAEHLLDGGDVPSCGSTATPTTASTTS